MSSFDRETHIDELMEGDNETAEEYELWLNNQGAVPEVDEISQEDLEAAADFYDNMQALAQESKSYVVMEWGDDYHGSRPVAVFDKEETARLYMKECDKNQVRDCGSETCDHKYWYSVTEVTSNPKKGV